MCLRYQVILYPFQWFLFSRHSIKVSLNQTGKSSYLDLFPPKTWLTTYMKILFSYLHTSNKICLCMLYYCNRKIYHFIQSSSSSISYYHFFFTKASCFVQICLKCWFFLKLKIFLSIIVWSFFLIYLKIHDRICSLGIA